MNNANNFFPQGPKSSWYQQALDICAGKRPEIANDIPLLLHWLEDYNWPGAHEIGEFVFNLGEIVVPHVKKIFLNSEDKLWKYWLLVVLVRRWPRQYINRVRDELIMLSQEDDQEEMHLSALEIIVRNKLEEPNRIKKLIDNKRRRHSNLTEELDELEAKMAT